MPSLTFYGKVEPPWYSMTFDYKPEVSYKINEIDVELKCAIEIDKSIVTVHCTVCKWDGEYISWVLNYVYDFVCAEVDLACFAWGKGFQVHLDRAVLPNGTQAFLVNDAPDLAALASAFKVSGDAATMRVELKDMMPIVMGRPTLMLAMQDLSAALRFGNNAAVNCGRAVEGMRKTLWGKDEAKNEMKASWQKMRTTLNVSEAYLTVVTDASILPRHGSSAYITSATRQEVFKRTWTLMNRLLIFYLKDAEPLSLEEFPILT